MPSRSRRALLRTLGAAVPFLSAGCVSSDSPAEETESPNESSGLATETTTESAPTVPPTPTDRDPATDTPGETETDAGVSLDCGLAARPSLVWPAPARTASGDAFLANGPRFETSPATTWAVTPTAPADKSAYDPVFTQPVIADGRLYVVKELQFGPNQEPSEYHVLQGRDAESGAEQWSVELTTRPTAPAVAGEAIVVGVGESVHAIDRRNGTERWTRAFESHVQSVIPTAEGCYVELDESVAVLASDGTPRWTATFDASVTTRPTLASGRLYVGTVDGSLHAVDADGTRLWTETTLREGYENDDAPSVDTLVATDCGVYATTDGDIYAFDSDGTFVWHAGEAYWGIATDGDRIYGGTGQGHVRALDAATGEQRWDQFYGTDDRRYVDGLYESPVVTDDSVYAFARPDTLLALDPMDGTERWTATRRVKGLVADRERLYGSRRSDGELVALGEE